MASAPTQGSFARKRPVIDDEEAGSSSTEYVSFDAYKSQPPPATPPPQLQRIESGKVFQSTESPAWVGTSEVVRDLHRSLTTQLPNKQIGESKSLDNLKIQRLHPDVGTASDLAQPGGFRRAHLVEKSDGDDGGAADYSYRATPLLVTLRDTGFIRNFVTRAVQKYEDGTEVRYESRPYRRGAKPTIVRTASGEVLVEPTGKLRFCGFRPRSVPYWASASFLIGATLFTEGSLWWMYDGRGDVDMWGVTYPYFIGSLGFTAGCYMAFVEVINANLSEDLAAGALKPEGSIHRTSSFSNGSGDGSGPASPKIPKPPPPPQADNLRLAIPPMLRSVDELPQTNLIPRDSETCVDFLLRLHWWRYQPHSLLWWAAFIQFIGACLFEIACCAGLPIFGVESYWKEWWLIYMPSTIGSLCFLFASYVYLLEVASDPTNPWKAPPLPRARPGSQPNYLTRERLGYMVAMCNLIGSFLYSLASFCYFARENAESPDWSGTVSEWEYFMSEWGLRFNYAIGSILFVAGAILSFPEALSDDW